jgi:hypothetical protein
LLAVERRTAPSVWHPGVSPSNFFDALVMAKFEELQCVDFPEEILQGEGADRGQTLKF